jgi:hypothetical protein
MFLMAETLRRFKALETAGQVDDQAQCEWRVGEIRIEIHDRVD